MRYVINVPNFGEFADPVAFAEVARQAEEAGWDGLLVWDHVVEQKDVRREIADPWVLLTAAALATKRIRLGTAITPVARRRPGKLAREVTTLDRLTGGRMVLGVRQLEREHALGRATGTHRADAAPDRRRAATQLTNRARRAASTGRS